jgi:hypothetical protein
MQIQLNAATRLMAANETVDNAIDWLYSYIYDSASIPERYRVASAVIPILRPLIDEVPYVPINKTLYHVIGSEEPLKDAIVLKPHQVTSYTYASTEEEWDDIAEAVGISSNSHYGVVKAVSGVKELTNNTWLHNKVGPYIKKNYPHAKFTNSLVELVEEYLDQKEVIAYSDSPVKTKLVKVFE